MDFVSFPFYVFLAAVVVVYYLFPLRFRWLVLLAGSLVYFCLATSYFRETAVFLGIIVLSWLLGLLQQWLRDREAPAEDSDAPRSAPLRKAVLALSIAAVLVPLILTKFSTLLVLAEDLIGAGHRGLLVSIGLSFFTMQIIAYLVDLYRGKIRAQRNPLKYALFVSFFPQLLQGPIPRYDQLEPQLIPGHRFDEKTFACGFMRILWGFFLKLMIADRAGLAVDTIFAEPELYQGAYVLVGGILYSVQLYADFLACTVFAQGAAELFGIRLAGNFRHPYFSLSIREFWGRWHISFSSWLRDYVYIPLGGSRRGKLRKYANLIVTFVVSGLWHGTGWNYVLWGLMHAGYQIVGAQTAGLRDRFFEKIRIPEGSRKRKLIRCLTTCFLVMLSWVLFRARSLSDGLFMLRSLFTTWNPWIFFDNSLLAIGLDWKEWVLLGVSVLLLFHVSRAQERFSIRERIYAQPFYLRLLLYVAVIAVVVVFGTYGYGFEAADFIYGGF